MRDTDGPVLLQVCPNDTPPFADICRYHEAAARSLGWVPLTVILEARAPNPEPAFLYLGRRRLAAALPQLLAGRTPALTLCHRYRACRVMMSSGAATAPVVAVAHEFGLLRRRRRRWQLYLDRWLGRPGVTFAGVSDAVTEELGDQAGHAVLLPNGIDLSRADAERVEAAAARSALGLSAHELIVGVVGRLHHKKAPMLAVEGFRRALPSLAGRPVRLVFVGTGPLEAEVAAGCAGLPATLKGFVADAPRLMRAFDLLVLPSGEREAFGMVALEAMAAGVPVLCGPAPGPRFVTGDAGLGFPADDPDGLARALVQACHDAASGALVELAHHARARVEEHFSVAAAAARLQALAASDQV